MPLIALLLADGECDTLRERAVVLYGLAASHPFVANSQLFENITGKQVAAAAAVLPPEVVGAAQSRGRARDWWETAELLLEELPELGWGFAPDP